MEYMGIREASEKWGLAERRITALCRQGKILGAAKIGKLWYLPENAPMPLDGRTKAAKAKPKQGDELLSFDEPPVAFGRHTRAFEAFHKKYHRNPEGVAFTPYRICPVGAHSDHQFGKITGFAIDKGIYIAYGPKQNGVIEIQSLQFPKRAQWYVGNPPMERQNDWADHLRGATLALSNRYALRVGLSAVIQGELPIGGLSSSAAVIITFLSALCRMNNIRLTKGEMIQLALEAENRFVGVACGKLDQSCEVYCKKDHLLYLDTKDDTYQLLPQNPKTKPWEIIIFFSGLDRSLSNSKFNMRVDECRSAAYALKAFAGMEYGKFEETHLREVPREIYETYKDKLPEAWRRRAEHWYTEFARVEAAAKAWEAGDIETFGRLSFESGKSSIENWETGSDELIALYNIMKETPGIYGGRFSGAGFKGCCMAIVDPAYEESILARVEKEYLKQFPHLTGKYSAHVCHSADGVKF